jgi:hypothetical protein
MKTITTFLAAVMLVAAVGSAVADQQRSDEAPAYALSQRMARHPEGAYAWAGARNRVRTPAAEMPYAIDLSGLPAAR